MRKLVLVLFAALSLTLAAIGGTAATPSSDHYPANPHACMGYSSTSANYEFQDDDAAKFRDEQAHGESYLGFPQGDQGRKDDVRNVMDGCAGN